MTVGREIREDELRRPQVLVDPASVEPVLRPDLEDPLVLPVATCSDVREPFDAEGQVDVGGIDSGLALVADRTRVPAVRRVQLELLAVVVERDVARELQPGRAPVHRPPARAPHERPGGRRQPHVGHGWARSTSSFTSAPQPGPAGIVSTPSRISGAAVVNDSGRELRQYVLVCFAGVLELELESSQPALSHYQHLTFQTELLNSSGNSTGHYECSLHHDVLLLPVPGIAKIEQNWRCYSGRNGNQLERRRNHLRRSATSRRLRSVAS